MPTDRDLQTVRLPDLGIREGVQPPPVPDLPEVRELRERVHKLVTEYPPQSTPVGQFRGRQFDAGLAWVHHPVGLGGLGLSQQAQQWAGILLSGAGVEPTSDRSVIGLGMAAPTLMAHGTLEQQEKHLRRIFTGEEVWCQLFSEPGAGSDLAALSTRARRDGDRWIVQGQKVWSSDAHRAQFGLLLARTDPDVAKHRGLTFFILDMSTPGVDVRPLRQITGSAEFNEVFLDEVSVPDTARVGATGDGWNVATSTLVNERAAIGAADSPFATVIPKLLGVWDEARGGLSPTSQAVRRDELVQVWCQARALRLSELRAEQLQLESRSGSEGSILKLLMAQVALKATELAVDLLGMYGTTYPSGYELKRPAALMEYENPQQFFLRCRSVSIGGGTSEVQHNIIAERVLGLPRGPSADKDIPWSKVRHSAHEEQ